MKLAVFCFGFSRNSRNSNHAHLSSADKHDTLSCVRIRKWLFCIINHIQHLCNKIIWAFSAKLDGTVLGCNLKICNKHHPKYVKNYAYGNMNAFLITRRIYLRDDEILFIIIFVFVTWINAFLSWYRNSDTQLFKNIIKIDRIINIKCI